MIIRMDEPGRTLPALPDVEAPSSILDLGNTLCGLAGIQAPPLARGTDWSPWFLEGRPVEGAVIYSEFFDCMPDGRETIGVMVRQGKLKYISYTGFREKELLFDLERDPQETHNLVDDHPQAKTLAKLAEDAQRQREPYLDQWHEQKRNAAYLAVWGAHYRERDPALWQPPAEVRRAPAGSVRS